MAFAALTCSVMQCGAGGGEVVTLAAITCSVGLKEEEVMDLAVIVCCVELMWCQVAPCGARGRGGYNTVLVLWWLWPKTHKFQIMTRKLLAQGRRQLDAVHGAMTRNVGDW
ncbi:hypothetical protein GN244_ATG13147 [Phytophthora infestans]|uniref:Uncharacterized protein n=1 Tax=Phytophthora infestans TaxID=4787 RepID=A0A833SY06_PHYIN|nr:hypothetical protein GN244_ATG13147 [Phytophthora infestans]KAF4135242.1 hypothetical protein GN958_ATG15561 [Phytophthora infestans]